MTTADYIRLQAQVAILKEVAISYHGRTIENIIQNIEARLKEARP